MSKNQAIQTIYNPVKGSPCPLGANFYKDKGVNFSVFSSVATKVSLLLFETCESKEPFKTIDLDKNENCEFGFWNIFVENLKPGIYYAYRVHTTRNSRNNNKVLLDPYTKWVSDCLWNRGNACNDSDNVETSMRGCVLDVSVPESYWEGIEKPHIPLKETIIYEMHVKGFTNSPTSEVQHKGTYSGIIEKIPYLKKLGVNAVELLPIMHFDTSKTGKEKDYWGYNTISFFAPQHAYCIYGEKSNPLDEFREMVKALHKNGIEVILDVVYNHTDEGNQDGPVINFKGFDNDLYYSLNSKGEYYNYSRCGNSLSCNHPIVQKMILESLEFWGKEMQVDGFRFDLGTILTLDTHGDVLEYPPVLWGIELNEKLTDCKLIAEPWGGDGSQKLYQLGDIHGFRWSQWNGKYRDCIRNFVKGNSGIISEVATRISGSSDLYQYSGHLPVNSINFITSHDGLTLNDLVSYTNDGQNSWDCGFSGETQNEEVNNLRIRQIKNFAAILFLSKGIPMMIAGDEMRRTQSGNDNGYQLDDEQGWLNWDLVKQNSEILNFFQKMINLRKQTYLLQTRHFYTGTVPEGNKRGLTDISWHGTILNKPGWSDIFARALAFTIAGVPGENIKHPEDYKNPEIFKDEDIHVMMNMYWEPLTFEIPQIQGRSWFIYADTFENQISEDILHSENTYTVRPRSIVILISK